MVGKGSPRYVDNHQVGNSLVEMSSEVAAQSCPLISEGAEEGVQNGIVTLACGNDGGAEGGLKRPGVLISSDGEELVVPGTSDGVSATVNRWYDVLKKSWFVYEAVMLLKLAFPLVRTSYTIVLRKFQVVWLL